MSTTPGIKLTCTHDGCEKRTVARRLCRAHYQAAWKARALDQHETLPPREKKHDYQCPPKHKHADASTCFIQHQCRCAPCVTAHNAREANRRRQKAYGRFDTGLVDAGPVREHVLMLTEYGIGYKRIAELAGVGTTGVRSLIWGRQDPGPRYGEIPKRVAREKAKKILAVQAVVENLGARRAVPALGTHRRIQALVARGWSHSQIARRLDRQIGNFWKLMQSDRVGADTHRRIAELYEQLWNAEPPHATWHEKAAYALSLRYAQRRGWLPPLAWDDIDTDPTPERDVVDQGRASGEELLEDITFLLEAGEGPEQIAQIVGRKPGAIAKLAERHGERDIATIFGVLTKRTAA